MIGLPDPITALNFDQAVMTFGIWVENRLMERNDFHMPVYTLEELLGLDDLESQMRRNSATFALLSAFTGGRELTV